MAGIRKKGNQTTIFFASTVSEAEAFVQIVLSADVFGTKNPLKLEKCNLLYCSLYRKKGL